MIQRSTESDLLREISGHKQVFALFYESWCPFCQRFILVFVDGREWSRPHALLVNLDDISNPLWETYVVDVVPTVLCFEEGKITRCLNGVLGKGLTKQQLEDFLAS